jgi:hypothetical protein
MKSTLRFLGVMILLFAGLLGLLSLVASDNIASAQDGQGAYVTQSTARLTKLIDAGNKDGYTLQNNTFSAGGGWLKQSTTDWVPLFYVNLQAGKKYRFLAAGDNDAKDVDLEVQDAAGKQVAVDALSDPERPSPTPPRRPASIWSESAFTARATTCPASAWRS